MIDVIANQDCPRSYEQWRWPHLTSVLCPHGSAPLAPDVIMRVMSLAIRLIVAQVLLEQCPVGMSMSLKWQKWR